MMLWSQEEFLSHFKNFYWKIFPDKNLWNNSDIKTNTNKTFEATMELNRQVPSSVYLIPNGNYALTNNVWESINISAGNTWIEKCWVYAYVLDFNLVKFPWYNMDTLLKHIKWLLEENINFKYRYIVKTPKSYHIYFVIDHNDREEMFNIYWYDQLKITKFLAEKLWADITSKVTTNPWSLFRMPFTYNYHLTEKEEIKIIESQDEYVGWKEISEMMLYIDIYNKLDREYKNAIRWVNWQKLREFDKQNVEEVVEKINRESNSEIKKDFFIENNKVVRKLWLDIYNYPIWSPYQLIRCLAKWVKKDLDNLLSDIFDIRLYHKKWKQELDWLMSCIEWEWYSVLFYEWSVILKNYWTTSKWEISEQQKILFRNTIKLLWKAYSTKTDFWWDWAEQDVFVMEVDWQKKIIHKFSDKRSLNKYNPDMFCYGNDNDVWLFFHALSLCDYIPVINIYEKNWYYNDVCILWDKCVVWYIDNDEVLLWENWFSLVKDDVKQITAIDYLNKFKECYKEEFAVPLYMAVISLWWMNFWDSLEVNPAVLLSWKTGSWKSTVASLLKRMLWYWTNARELALPGITPQPLKQLASDSAILFLEELTNKVSAQTEELLRNIVNRDKTARWTLTDNVWRNLSSPLWVNWERTFKDESLNNRFCIFMMSQSYWKEWWLEKTNELYWYTAYIDVYNTFINNKDILPELINKYKNKLLTSWHSSRTSDVWSYVFVVNEIFWFNYSYEKLEWYMKIHLKNIWAMNKITTSSEKQLERFLSVNIINWKINFTVQQDEVYEEWKQASKILFNMLFIDPDIYQTYRWTLNSLISDINEKYWKTMFEIDDWWIIWYMDYIKDSRWNFIWDENKFISWMFSRIQTVLPAKIANSNRSLQLIDR